MHCKQFKQDGVS